MRGILTFYLLFLLFFINLLHRRDSSSSGFASANAGTYELIHRDHFDVPHIAMCISGQTSRMLPRLLKKNLFDVNTNFMFHLFYNLHQTGPKSGQSVVYNTMEGYTSSFLADKSLDYIGNVLGKLYSYPHVSLKNLSFWEQNSAEYWKSYFNLTRLNFMSQYEHVQQHILNMYRHHVNCALQIEREESLISQRSSKIFRYKYVISTREDVYILLPMNLSKLASFVSTDVESPNPNYHYYFSVDNLRKNNQFPASTSCDVIHKNCLIWGGVNMRFQFWKRDHGVNMLKNRLTFYKERYGTKFGLDPFPLWLKWEDFDFDNPEKYEKYQYAFNNLTICTLEVDDIPVAAVRKTYNDKLCFHKFEILNCYPNNNVYPEVENFLVNHRCDHFKYPAQIDSYDDYYSDSHDVNATGN